MEIEKLFMAACAGDMPTLKEYYSANGKKNLRYKKFGKENSLIMGAFRNNQWKTLDYLLSVGETITEKERKALTIELQRINYLIILLKGMQQKEIADEFVKQQISHNNGGTKI